MSGPVTYNNAIRFACDDGATTLWLGLDGEFEMTAGVKPNVNAFTCFYRDFQQLLLGDGQIPARRRQGRLEFFHSEIWDVGQGGPQGGPDLTLQRMEIVDAEVLAVGVDGITTVRVFVADRRHTLVWPRGGVVDSGEINKQPHDGNRGVDANGNPIRKAGYLVRHCLTRMGLEITIPGELDTGDLAAPVDVEWRGNHAPTELEQILDGLGYLFTIDAEGAYAIVRRDAGPQPTFPPEAMPTPALGVDRRGATVVFSSYPYPATDTREVTGLGDYKKPDAEKDVLEYVFWNPKEGKFVNLAEAMKDLWGGKDPKQLLQEGYVEGYSQEWVKVVTDSAFRCIRINPKHPDWGERPFLARVVEDRDRGLSTVAQVKAIRPILGADGLWRNTTDQVPIHAVHLMDGGRALVFGDYLMKIDPDAEPAADPRRHLIPLTKDDLTVTATVECRVKEKGADGVEQWLPEYFHVGFVSLLGRIRRLGDAELKLAMLKPETMIVPRPDLQLRRKDGVDQNRERMQDKAFNYAPFYIKGSGEPSTRVAIPGFAPYVPGARISRVRIGQSPPMTTVEVNTWYFPHVQVYLRRDKRSGPRAAQQPQQEAFPKQAETALARSAQGFSGAAPPVAAVAPFPSVALAASGQPIVKIVGTEKGGAHYKGKLMKGSAGKSPAAKPDADLPLKAVEGDGGMLEGDDCLVLNLDEASGKADASGNLRRTHWAYLGTSVPLYYPCSIVGMTIPPEPKAGEEKEKPKPIVVISAPAPTTPFLVTLKQDDGANGSPTSPATWKYTVKLMNSDGEVVGTKVGPKVERPNGRVSPATLGLGYYDAERQFKLLIAFESVGTGGCG